MKGCLSLPFRLLLLGLVVLGGFVAWSYRHEIRRRIHDWTAESRAADPAAVGIAALAPAVHRKLAALSGTRADTVLLSARELAHLIAAAAASRLPGALDSLEVRLDRDDLELRGRVDTRRLELSLGPLAGVLKDHERLEAGGRLLFRGPGLAEWEVSRVRVRGLPMPKDVIARAWRRLGAGDAGALPVPLPRAVSGLRVTPGGLVLYGPAPAGTPR